MGYVNAYEEVKTRVQKAVPSLMVMGEYNGTRWRFMMQFSGDISDADCKTAMGIVNEVTPSAECYILPFEDK